MTIARTLTVLSLTIAALFAANEPAKADNLQDIFRTIRQVRVSIDSGGSKHKSPGFGGGHHTSPPNYGGGHGHKQICPLPPPPRHCVYCVYYYDCHCGWKLYRCFNDRWTADSEAHRLRHQGYRTYVKVKHVSGGYPSFPGGPASY